MYYHKCTVRSSNRKVFLCVNRQDVLSNGHSFGKLYFAYLFKPQIKSFSSSCWYFFYTINITDVIVSQINIVESLFFNFSYVL